MKDDEKSYTVNIFGTDYPLKSHANINYVKKVADYVDAKMKEVHRAKPNRPLHQIAILAAMNITDELLQSREIDRQKHLSFEEKVTNLAKQLEKSINDSTEGA